MRGLETFSQLVDYSDNSTSYSINCLPTIISDTPRFPWRGFLMDTARHYLLPSTIFRTIDALSYSKFNTLHWHAVDAESFPVISDTYPLLSQEGAYAPSAVYSHELIKAVVAYGKERGIRVVPEFDMPGHAYSWGKGYPDLVVDCPDYNSNINNVPLNPTLNSTYTMLASFIPEMAKLFTDDCFHIGGDEVVFGCWEDNAQVTAWMQQNGLDAVGTLQYFEDMVAPILSKANKNPVVWEDLFDDGVNVPTQYIVEVWSDQSTLQSLVKAGYRTLTAYGYYLNNQEPSPGETTSQWVDTWKLMYSTDPLDNTSLTPEEIDLVIGGEAAMWGEQVESLNYDSRVWPRACAVSERLWSPQDVVDQTDATTRLTEHRCRIARRGVGASPIVPDYCSLPYTPYVEF
uniref:beta-N-acetylhexosaminidase n=2 Tax=Vannella robusta TaxID=1487602 RepID=A0A7S4I501_9EUKA|mmetsp:Transcript_2062/g.2520  ORF Transcript_2062/g.2520 Transcript_2062/m.2520 type:complete len:401 (+) Transcript_2062:1-1203(+)